MATFYVDIDDSFTQAVDADGTPSKPYDYNWFTGPAPAGTHTFYFRGSRTLSTNFAYNPAFQLSSVLPWDMSLYGPWRINGGSSYEMYITATMKGGIIYCPRIHSASGPPMSVPIVLEDLFINARFDFDNQQSTPNYPTFRRCTVYNADIASQIAAISADTCGAFDSSLLNCGLIDNNGNMFGSVDMSGTASTKAGFNSQFVWDGGLDPYLTLNDLGGNVWGATLEKSLPAWDSTNLTDFNLLDGYGVGATGSWATTTAPNWASTYPKTGTIGGTSVEILSQTDMDGTSYAVVAPDGASAPTAQQVKDGEDSTGTPVAAGFANSVALIADTEANMFLTNLVSETAYDIYVVAEGALLQDNPIKLDVTTSDITDPINAAGYPKVNTLGETTASFLTKTNENGMAYVVIIPRGANSPTSVQVKAGQDSTGTSVAAGFSGSASLVANTEATLNVSNLSIGTRYDAYIVAEDAPYNLQDSPIKVEFSTIPKIVSQMNVPKSYIGSYVVINVNGLIVTTDKTYPGSFTIDVEVGNQYEIVPYTGLDATDVKVRIKVLSQTNDECLVLIKVNDGENDSNTFYYKIVIVAGTEKPKTKPVGYGIDVTTRQ